MLLYSVAVGSSRPVRPLVIGRYALLGEIATGGMATVHFGRLLGPAGFARTVAVKRLHAQHARDPEFVEMLLDEGRIAARVHHPNVVQTLDVVSVGTELLLVMEYVHGESLAECLRVARARGRPIPLDVVSSLICGILHGLHAAHEATDEQGAALHVVHRDVSPQNVLVGADGVTRVLDFGVAKAVGRLATTREGQLKGKLAYMAPEQLGARESVDRRTDVYAAGVVLWETLARQRLFTGDNEAVVIREVLEQPVPPPSSIDHDVPARVDAIALQALDRDPAKRFATARAMALALEAAVPLASATRVARWLDELVGDQLAVRTRMRSHVERELERLARQPPDDGAADDDETVVNPETLPAPVADKDETRPQGSRSEASKSEARRWPRRRLALIGTAAAASVAGVLAVVLAARGGPRDVPSPAPSSGADHAVITLTDLPLPGSNSKEALAAFREAMQATRDGVVETALGAFARALTADPGMGAAHMRIAFLSFPVAPSDARAHFERALALRGTLSERDSLVLDAMAPYIESQPSDFALARARLEAAVARYPDDAELPYLLGLAIVHVEPRPIAITCHTRAIELDPSFGLAYYHLAQQWAYSGDVDAALRTIDHCLARVPSSVACLQLRIAIDEQRGLCDRVQTDSTTLIARDPLGGTGHHPLADALYALGGSLDAARAALASTWDHPLDDDATGRHTDGYALAVLAGRFDEAEREARALERQVSASTDRGAHATAARWLVALYEETGRADAAASVADAYLRRKDAWTADPRAEDYALIRDPTPVMLEALARAGRLSGADFDRQRGDWVEHWRSIMGPEQAPFVWLHGFADVANTPEEATTALDAIGRYGPIPKMAFHMLADEDVGRTYLLGGRVEQGLPFLRRAAASCLAIDYPMAHTRASYLLGQALEATGDADGACAAYRVVQTRWGAGTPKSTTAGRARARIAALRCPQAP
jgi:serine/threonine protein kinase/Tfp pilus assembly protein PilF